MKARYKICTLTSITLFATYYVYDLPALLTSTSNTNVQALYASYAFPAILIPFLIGPLSTLLGVPTLLYILSTCVFVGQSIFTIGLVTNNTILQLIGRIVLGLGSEGVGVVQAEITSRWFNGHEMALALGVNVCIGRMGGVANDLVTPAVARWGGETMAGTVGCVMCLGTVFVVAVLAKVDGESYVCSTVIEMVEVGGSSDEAGDEVGAEADDENYGFLVEASENPPSNSLLSSMSAANTSPTNRLPSNKFSNTLPLHQYPTSPKASRKLKRKVSFTGSTPKTTAFIFPLHFWLLCITITLLESIMITFTALRLPLLNRKFYRGNVSSTALALPDFISALLVPAFGALVDIGYRKLVILCPVVIFTIIHFIFLITPQDKGTYPVPLLITLAIGYAMVANSWAHIPLLVPAPRLAYAFGLATSICNCGLVVLPIIVGYLVKKDPTFSLVEGWFVALSIVTGIVGVLYLRRDRYARVDVEPNERKGFGLSSATATY